MLERDRWGVEGSASSKLTETVVWLVWGLRLDSIMDWLEGEVFIGVAVVFMGEVAESQGLEGQDYLNFNDAIYHATLWFCPVSIICLKDDLQVDFFFSFRFGIFS